MGPFHPPKVLMKLIRPSPRGSTPSKSRRAIFLSARSQSILRRMKCPPTPHAMEYTFVAVWGLGRHPAGRCPVCPLHYHHVEYRTTKTCGSDTLGFDVLPLSSRHRAGQKKGATRLQTKHDATYSQIGEAPGLPKLISKTNQQLPCL